MNRGAAASVIHGNVQGGSMHGFKFDVDICKQAFDYYDTVYTKLIDAAFYFVTNSLVALLEALCAQERNVAILFINIYIPRQSYMDSLMLVLLSGQIRDTGLRGADASGKGAVRHILSRRPQNRRQHSHLHGLFLRPCNDIMMTL